MKNAPVQVHCSFGLGKPQAWPLLVDHTDKDVRTHAHELLFSTWELGKISISVTIRWVPIIFDITLYKQ